MLCSGRLASSLGGAAPQALVVLGRVHVLVDTWVFDFDSKNVFFVPQDLFEADGRVEMIELRDHPWFLACQFHPEFKSRPLSPHPLFRQFIRAAKAYRDGKSEAADTQTVSKRQDTAS